MFLNFEVAPARFDIEDYFQMLTLLFKKNFAILNPEFHFRFQEITAKTKYFLVYQNSKSTACLHPRLLPDSVDSFDVLEEDSLFTTSPAILHYLNCGFQNDHKKYPHTHNPGQLPHPSDEGCQKARISPKRSAK
ncbi:MAG: hypothetical protein ACUVRV_04825 [Cyanobacteriota bacterium]